ncbi:MAG TPA: class D sortase [Terriglobales bacterium]|nr:class D sortase [Terriglobales bacterium]
MQVLRTKPSGRSRPRPGRSKLILKAGSWRPNEFLVKPKLLANKRQIVAYLLIVTGGILCTGVLGTYSWMYWKQHSLLMQWNERVATRDSMTKLWIPRIKLEDVVLEGVGAESLLLGPGHMENSVEPGLPGNAVIAGHRDTFFRKLHKLRPGDDVYVLRDGHQLRYKVTARKIVEPNDLSVLKSSDKPEITLITCYPTHAIGPAPKRLVVVATMPQVRTGEGARASMVPLGGAIPASPVK